MPPIKLFTTNVTFCKVYVTCVAIYPMIRVIIYVIYAFEVLVNKIAKIISKIDAVLGEE